MQEGDYLSRAYLNSLKSTRSPLEADKAGSLTMLRIARRNAQVSITPGFNFHESGDQYFVGTNGSVLPAKPDPYNTRNLYVAGVSDGTLKFGLDDSSPADYVFVGEEYAYVAQIVIAGKYHDSRNRSYEFTADGRAVFPERSFKYEIGLDHVLNPYDYYMENGRALPWAFKRTGKELQIFATAETQDGFEEITSNRPMWILYED
jgi:hypothetical protein